MAFRCAANPSYQDAHNPTAICEHLARLIAGFFLARLLMALFESGLLEMAARSATSSNSGCFLKQLQRRHHLPDEREMLIAGPQFNVVRHRDGGDDCIGEWNSHTAGPEQS